MSREAERSVLVGELAARGIRDERVLAAMGAVPRHAFVPDDLADRAYADGPLPIGNGQTISQPFVVAWMCEAARVAAAARVLEIGTGSGYGAAVLGALAHEVHTVERLPGLAERAAARLGALGLAHVQVHVGDGSLGWPGAAPYDAIVVTAGGPTVPRALVAQLAPGAALVIPVGPERVQRLLRITRTVDGREHSEDLGAVQFVPLIGLEAWDGAARRRPGKD